MLDGFDLIGMAEWLRRNLPAMGFSVVEKHGELPHGELVHYGKTWTMFYNPNIQRLALKPPDQEVVGYFLRYYLAVHTPCNTSSDRDGIWVFLIENDRDIGTVINILRGFLGLQPVEKIIIR